VSVRTLHHYERIGLLTAAERSPTGYRLYSSEHLLALQQILTLRYLGFGLWRIAELLERPDFDVVASLRVQRAALADRRAELDRIAAGLDGLLERRLASGRWDWDLVREASATVQTGIKQKGGRMNDYYTPEEIAREVAGLAADGPGGRLRAAERQWRQLLAEVHANLDLPPEGPQAQALAARWDQLHELARPLFAGREKLWRSLGRAHLDGRYDHLARAAHAEDYAFIQRVREATPSY
jgi:DNA-binding transcriptional MerR regulator